MHSVARRRQKRPLGMTLIEVMIVVAILGLLSGAIGLAAMKHKERADREATLMSARTLRAAVQMWRIDHGGECPSPATLRRDGAIDDDGRLEDAWRRPYRIVCESDGVKVLSAGPDGREGTDDDIQSPAREAPSS